jgi:3-demethoxyubiquinol 3-hydroxylase
MQLMPTTVTMPMADALLEKSSSACSEVLFDGSCPLCSQEIDMYRKLPARAKVQWVDVSNPSYCPPHGTTRALLMQRFHAITPEGELLSGARAFMHVWALLPGWHYLARAAKVPGILWLMETTYRTFLIFRPWMQAAYRRWSTK